MAVLSKVSSSSSTQILKSGFHRAKRKLVGNFPLSYRRKLYIRRFDLFNQSGNMDGIEICLAKTIPELEAAFGVVHDAYIESGFINPSPEKMRIRAQDFLPTTAIFVAKQDGQVIGTMSVIIDSPLGLPMEGPFGPEIKQLRGPGVKLGEVSGLAVCKKHRRIGLVTHLARACECYLNEVGCTKTCITVSPNMSKFYSDFFFFRQISSVRSYSKDHYDPVAGMVRDDSKDFGAYKAVYSREPSNYNLYKFMRQIYDLKLAQDIAEHVKHPVLDEKVLNHFFSSSVTLRQQILVQDFKRIAECCGRIIQESNDISEFTRTDRMFEPGIVQTISQPLCA